MEKKKKYIKPDIREEYEILTVRAWVTRTQHVVANSTTSTTYTLQEASQMVTETSYALLNSITRSSYLQQQLLTRTGVAIQRLFSLLS